MFDLLIKNCNVLRVDGSGISLEAAQDICIEENRIVHIVPGSDHKAVEVIDASNMLAIPGLINTHCHSPMVLFRGSTEDVRGESWFNDYVWLMEANLTAEDVYWGALLGIAEMIENGITYVADRYSFMDQVAMAVEESGIRANLVWTIFENQGLPGLEQSEEFIVNWQGRGNGRITTWVGPHAPYTVGPEYLRRCAQQAKKLDVGVHIHVSERREQVERSLKEYGVTPIKLLEDTGILDVPTLLGHCKYPTLEDLEILSRRNTGIAQAPKTYLRHPSYDFAAVLQFRELGIPVGLATDGAASNSTLDILEQMRLLALLVKNEQDDATAMPAEEVLDITLNGGAQVVQLAEQLGSLEPGKLADITLLRQNSTHLVPETNVAANLIYSVKSSDVDTVICDGKVLMQGRKLLTIDIDEVKEQVKSRVPRLLRKDKNARVATYPT